jgi:lysophospholipase L1-like esterase
MAPAIIFVMRCLPLFLLCASAASAQQFDFGPGKITPDVKYSDERGYGFEQDTHYFSIKVQDEGNYRVTVTFGSATASSVTTVKAELRRLMIEKVVTAPGQFETRSFIVNVRHPEIAGGGEVRLKDREKTSEAWAWDDKLTLEFCNSAPAYTHIAIEKAGDIPTIYIAGDSTSTDQPLEPFNSWGQMLTRFFTPGVAIANHGESGESLKGFIGERRLAKLMSVIQPGDWLFIQMGHNDQKERGEGVGAFTTYKADLKRFIAEARQHGATPVLITSMHRLTFDHEGKITNSLGDYPEAARQAAREERVALIDLNAMSKPFYEALGPVDAHRAFAGKDTTHHSDYGSYELAKCIVQGIKSAELPLAKFLVDVPAFDPAHPDPLEKFDVPAEPQPKSTIFVVGDSTASNGGDKGWGDQFAAYFDLSKVNVVNRAIAGRSARTYTKEGRWDKVAADLKSGDFVLIQFGHNDGGAPDQPPYRGDLPGLGDEQKEVTNAAGQQETVHTFGWYLRKFVRETKEKGATPILLSPTVRNIWTGASVERQMGHFAEWDKQVADAEGVMFLDEANAIADAYEKLGPEKVKDYFPIDHTHTNPEGAELNASIVVATLKGANSPVVAFLSEKGAAVPAYPAPLNPATAGGRLPVPANPNLPTLFLIGDSTVRNGRGDGSNGQWGWGEPIVDFFDASKINVVNRAVGGLSSRTYLTGGHWDRVLALLKPGDFVMMQFGHNDSGPLDDAARARGTLKGAGDETREIDNPISKEHEVVHTYGWYLRKFIVEARAKGATPIMCTLIPRKIWKDGKIVRNTNDYAGWAAAVAQSEHVPLIDLNERIAAAYDAMGAEKVEPMFGDPHTHTSRAGAELNAAMVIEGLKALADDPLAQYLK